jgi:RimJ/RimL family protein N-acetyltransferase
MTSVEHERSTERLTLRRWRAADHEPFAALNADPDVMEYLPVCLSRAESDQLIARSDAGFDQRGYGLWALELRATREFIGFTGLDVPSFESHFTPAVEVGWRLARAAWGHGYATEAGRAALAFGFEEAGLDEIVSLTSAVNLRSRAVMERIGMTHHAADDFDHPELEVGDSLSRHVLYRMSVRDWASPRPALKDEPSTGRATDDANFGSG